MLGFVTLKLGNNILTNSGSNLNAKQKTLFFFMFRREFQDLKHILFKN